MMAPRQFRPPVLASNGGATPNSTASSDDELHGVTNEESPAGKARSPRESFGLQYDRQHHSKEAGGKLRKRALCLTFHMWNAVTCKSMYYEGQAFIIQITDQDESKKLCTIKHSLVSEPNNQGGSHHKYRRAQHNAAWIQNVCSAFDCETIALTLYYSGAAQTTTGFHSDDEPIQPRRGGCIAGLGSFWISVAPLW